MRRLRLLLLLACLPRRARAVDVPLIVGGDGGVFQHPESDYNQITIESGACTDGLETTHADCAIFSQLLTGVDLEIVDSPNAKGCIFFPGNPDAGVDAIVQWNARTTATPGCSALGRCVCNTYSIWQLPSQSCGGDADQVFSTRTDAREACENAGCLGLADARYLDKNEVIWRQAHDSFTPVFGGQYCSTDADRRLYKANWYQSIATDDADQIVDQNGDPMRAFWPAWYMGLAHGQGAECGIFGWNVQDDDTTARAACTLCPDLSCNPSLVVSPPPPPDGTCTAASYTTAPDFPLDAGLYTVFEEADGCPDITTNGNAQYQLADQPVGGYVLKFCSHVAVVDGDGDSAGVRKLERPRCLQECTQTEYDRVTSCSGLCPAGFACCASLGDTCVRECPNEPIAGINNCGGLYKVCPACPDCSTTVDNGGDSFWFPKNGAFLGVTAPTQHVECFLHEPPSSPPLQRPRQRLLPPPRPLQSPRRRPSRLLRPCHPSSRLAQPV